MFLVFPSSRTDPNAPAAAPPERSALGRRIFRDIDLSQSSGLISISGPKMTMGHGCPCVCGFCRFPPRVIPSITDLLIQPDSLKGARVWSVSIEAGGPDEVSQACETRRPKPN